MTKIGFIGLGIMGRGMARNLITKGFDVTVWNRTARKMDEFVAEGAVAGQSPKDVSENCDIIMVCVSDTPDVEAVVHGDNGILAGISAGKLVIDHSTISPHATLELAQAINDKGAFWLDAPISGGNEGAEKGTLSIMVGGDIEQFERAKPYLEAIGKTITHVGKQGAGQMVKLVNQILVVINCLAVSEALMFAEAGGLDLQSTLAAVEGGAAGSWMLSNRGSQMIVRDWRPGFTINLQQKDLRLVLEAADQLGIPVLATSMVFNLYRTLQQQGLGEEGNHSLVKALEKMTGFEVGAEE
ncbi:MAG: NAD(P)-dependent oxidoreductase [Phototrophicaceae bacterium]